MLVCAQTWQRSCALNGNVLQQLCLKFLCFNETCPQVAASLPEFGLFLNIVGYMGYGTQMFLGPAMIFLKLFRVWHIPTPVFPSSNSAGLFQRQRISLLDRILCYIFIVVGALFSMVGTAVSAMSLLGGEAKVQV